MPPSAVSVQLTVMRALASGRCRRSPGLRQRRRALGRQCQPGRPAEGASFAFAESRIGLAPAMISLTTLDIMNPRQAARYYLTGETFEAAVAVQLSLVTVACGAEEIDGVLDGLVAQVRQTSPQGSAETKKLLPMTRRQQLEVSGSELVKLSARLFVRDEAQESIHTFLFRTPA